MKLKRKNIIVIIILLLISIIYTLLVKVIDVKAIGPKGSSVGFSLVNGFFHNNIGENKIWYYLTEVLGIISILLALLYAFIRFMQLINRKSIKKIDKEILILGSFYVIVLLVYIFFEKVIINYRPILTNNLLEASYPSSHTMLSLCICGGIIILNKKLYRKKRISKIMNFIALFIMIVTTIGRLLSGVHWVTDILGGIIISITLLYIFYSFLISLNGKNN